MTSDILPFPSPFIIERFSVGEIRLFGAADENPAGLLPGQTAEGGCLHMN
jgi:hypothetical protein